MGTGVGEAMLIGAATGAGTSALTGGDPLKGAMFGALGGGIGSGIGGALGGSTGAVASTTGQVAGQTAGQLAGQTAGQVAGQTAAQTAGQVVGQTAGQTAGQLAGQTAGQTAGQVAGQTAAPGMNFMDIFKPSPQSFGTRLGTYMAENPGKTAMAGSSLANMLFNKPKFEPPSGEYDGPLKRFRYNPDTYRPAFAQGGITDIDLGTNAQLSQSPVMMMAKGGISDLGSYSDGGRLLKGPGDGMSDSIPAKIGRRQPARLADGEFVVPADVVSHLGNGSTDAGAKQLYEMMDKVRRARTGNKKQGKEINPRKYVPA